MARTNRCFFGFLAIFLLLGFSSHAQERKGGISGHVTDVNHDALVGARVEVQPNGTLLRRTRRARSRFPTWRPASTRSPSRMSASNRFPRT